MGRVSILFFLYIFFFFILISNTFAYAAPVIPGDSVTISGIIINGNKVTRDEIIYRELTFKKGDEIAVAHLTTVFDSSTQNLMNTFLFNFVNIRPEFPVDSLHAVVFIEVSERWYWWPEPVFSLVDVSLGQWLKEKDFNQTTYGLILTRKNFRGRNETVSVGVQQGFSERYSMQFRIPYINRRLKDGISVGLTYLRSKQALFDTFNNRPLYLKSLDYIRKDFSLNLSYSYRRGFYHTTGIYTSYRNTEIGDTVLTANSDFFINGDPSQKYFTLGVFFTDDHRDYHAYPLRGYYAGVDISKSGFNILKDDVDHLTLITVLKGYKDLGQNFYWAGAARFRFTNLEKQSFFNQVSVGSGSTGIQGFEDYFILGQNTYIFKSALKYNVLKERVLTFNFVPIEKFSKVPLAVYFNLFTDAGYIENKYYRQKNDVANQLLYGYGLGFDFVTYYNLVLRVEYSFNKFGESGFYIHFSSPI